MEEYSNFETTLNQIKLKIMNKNKIGHWILRLIPAFIFIQTLFFKFTAAPETIYIFEKLGLPDPMWRIISGVTELIAAVLILNPRTTGLGAVLGATLMVGALASHLTKLGIEVQGDGGTLFGMGILILLCCSALIWINRKSIPVIGNIFS